MAVSKKKSTTAKRKTTSTAKKKPASKTKRKPGKLKRQQKREEIAGLCIGIVGIYTFLCIFTEYAGKWGVAVHDAMFGSFGLLAYVLPFAIVALGIAIIVKRKHKIKILNILVWVLFGLCVVCIFHIASLQITYGDEYDRATFKGFVSASYKLWGTQGLGTGALAAIISYPLVKNIDAWGSYLVFAGYIVIFIIVKLRISLRKIGRDVGDKISETSTRVNENVKTKAREIIERRRLYIDDLSKEDDPEYGEDLKVLANNDFNYVEHEEEVPEFLNRERKRHSRIEQVPIHNIDQNISQEKASEKKKDTTEDEWNKAKSEVGENNEPPPYAFPPISLLERSSNQRDLNAEAECRDNAVRLEETLESFGIPAKVMQVSRGPAVTRFELQPPPGVKISRITNLSNDIALSLAAQGVRIEAPIPGKAAIGIEIPNENVAVVKLRDIIESSVFAKAKSSLSFCLGKDITGKNVVTDLSRMPHMLIAGATGSGKSVCINSIIISFIYKSSPENLRMILIDPKRVELSIYNGIPHLLIPVVNDAKKAAGALNWAINEMSKRYQLFSDNMARDISRYNEIAEGKGLEKLPQIVIIIDELADLMAIARNEVEDSIVRLAQLARAAGIHLIIATQRPSVDVITGIIKANIPTRIAFSVYSQIDARTILDTTGAEKLLGRGDMLFNPSGAPKPIRLQGAFVTEKEVHDVTQFIKNDKANYSDEIIEDVNKMEKAAGKKGKNGATEMDEPGLDNLVNDGIDVIFDMEQASISLLQRKLRVGYARAARIVDDIERVGVIGPKNGSKPREILTTRQIAHEKVEQFEG